MDLNYICKTGRLAFIIFENLLLKKNKIVNIFFIISLSTKNYSFTLPAVRPLTKYFSKYMKIKSTGKVTITEPAIKY